MNNPSTDPQAEAFFVAGKIVGVFGVRGWVKIKPYTEDPKSILQYQPWVLKPAAQLSRATSEAKQLAGKTAFKVVEHQFRPQGLVVKFEGLDDRDEAAALNGWLIEVGSENLPQLSAGDYYWRDLIGLSVISRWQGKEQALGCVKSLLETGANDVLVVQGKPTEHLDDRERLIPYVMGQYIEHIDLSAGKLIVNWDPEF